MTRRNKSVGILGGGISGLSTAYALQQKGFEISVYEQAGEAGGVIKTRRDNGWQTEAGPNSMMLNSNKIRTLLEEIGLEPHIRQANPTAKKRFIVKNGKPVAVPLSFSEVITTKLISAGAKIRLLKEPFVKTGDQKDENIASFFGRRIGQEPVDYGINPFVSGIYAGDPEQLSIKHTFGSLYKMEQDYGSIFKGMLAKRKKTSSPRSLISFSDGMQMLPDTFAKHLGDSLKLNHTVKQIASKGNRWTVRTNTGGRELQRDHDVIISTLPIYHMAEIVAGKDLKSTARELKTIPYVPLSVLHLGFKKENVSHPLDGFGMLIPEKEQFNLLGVLFPSTLFPGRTPKDYALITCFIGGARQPHLAKQPKRELINLAVKDLDLLLGLKSEPVFIRHIFWQNAIPQYHIGYDRYLSKMKEIERSAPGLFLEGNYRNGVSVPDRLSAGLEKARKVELFLKEST